MKPEDKLFSARQTLTWSAGVIFALVAAACGDESSSTDAGADTGSDGANSVVAVFTRVTNPDSRNFYLHLLPELPEGGVELDYSKAYEFGEAFASVSGGHVYVSDREALTVTKYAVTDDLELDKRGEVSFQGLGLSFVGVGWLDEDSPVIIDSESGQVVRFDPDAMVLGETAEIPEALLTRNDITGWSWGWNGAAAGNQVYFGWSWIDYDSYETVPAVAVAPLPLDGEPDFGSMVSDDRCQVSEHYPWVGPQGNVYVVGLGPLQVADQVPSCVLRLEPGASQFDPDYQLDLLEALDARDIYGSWPMDGGAKILAQYWPNAAPTPDTTDYWEMAGMEEWRIGIVDLETGQGTAVDEIPKGGVMSHFSLELDGERYVQVYEQDGDTLESVLYLVTPTGATQATVKAGTNGDFQYLARVR